MDAQIIKGEVDQRSIRDALGRRLLSTIYRFQMRGDPAAAVDAIRPKNVVNQFVKSKSILGDESGDLVELFDVTAFFVTPEEEGLFPSFERKCRWCG